MVLKKKRLKNFSLQIANLLYDEAIFFVLLLFVFLAETSAQNTSWFYGTWRGETYFPNGPVTKRIIIKLKVTKVAGNTFTATLENLFPSDTIVRLKRAVTGTLAGKKFTITSNEQTYIRDLRTQNFWFDCTGCQTQSSFAINSDKIEIKINTINCGDICNGETTFSRDTSDLDSTQKKQLAKWFGLPAQKTIAKTKEKRNDSTVRAATAENKPTKKDTVAVTNLAKKAAKKDTPEMQAATATDTLANALTTRATNLISTYHVTSPHIIIQLYDNAEIDGDIVSVFHNGKRIADHQLLTHKAITITINASPQDRHHEFVMVAENLGLIPPNTALMRITAGTQKFELEVSSDLDNNAKIAIDYTGE